MNNILNFKKDKQNNEQVLCFAPEPITMQGLTPTPMPIVIIAILVIILGTLAVA